jgi:hypothetical protein
MLPTLRQFCQVGDQQQRSSYAGMYMQAAITSYAILYCTVASLQRQAGASPLVVREWTPSLVESGPLLWLLLEKRVNDCMIV